jgi:ribosomal protein S18 acetylase RimI-like enzyme
MAVKALRTWIRAVDGRDASSLLRLHRELWFDHDARGGMPASTDSDVWRTYGDVLERQLAHRDGRRAPSSAFEGKLGHLVAEWEARVVGQVEVYLDRFGWDPRTPHIAELRSLIVTRQARGLGLGAGLVREAAATSRARTGSSTIVAAEVLARNEALAFYDRLGFRTLERLTAITALPPAPEGFVVRPAVADDAGELAMLDHVWRARRQGWGDPRFDPVSLGVGADLVRMISDGLALDEAQRAAEPGRAREEILVRDLQGRALAAGYLVASPLGPPFAPVMRAEIARVAANPDDPRAVLAAHALVAYAFRRVSALGAPELLVRSPFLDPVGASIAEKVPSRAFSWILAAPASTILKRAGTKP